MYQLDTRKYWSDAYVPIQFKFRDPQHPFPLHAHDWHEIALIYSGEATHITKNGEYEIQGGDFINVKLGQIHGFKNIRNLVLMNILIRPSFFEEDPFGLQSIPAYEALFGRELEMSEKAPVIHFRLEFGAFSRAKTLIEAAFAELTERVEGYRAMVTSLVREFVVLLIRNYRVEKKPSSGFAVQALNLVNYVKDHYHAPLCMADLTGLSGMSESHVLRLFKQYLGCSPFQYISRLRLSEASEALIQTDKSITQIALDLGFNDSNYFTRSFRKQTGISPREYRDKYLKENLLQGAYDAVLSGD
jgi:AraC-like DNA-binding protein